MSWSDVQDLLQQMSDFADLKALHEEDLEEKGAEIIKKIEAEQQRISDAQARIERLHADLEAVDPAVARKIQECDVEIRLLRDQIKKSCHALPLDVVREGQALESSAFRVKVGRVTVARVYAADRMVQERPDLLQLSVDGDPVVEHRINEAVLERLIARSEIEGDWVEKFKTEVKTKNPSVRFEEIS